MTETACERKTYDWDQVNDVVESIYAECCKERQAMERKAAYQNLSVPEYLAARITHSVQEVIDFNFQSRHNWSGMYEVLKSVCSDFEGDSSEYWGKEARTRKRSRHEYLAARLTRYIGEIVDFESYHAYCMANR